MSLYFKVREPKITTENPNVLILLHGYGSNEDDLFSFAEELPEELLIVTARAPYEMGYGGYAWYAINFDANNEKFSDLDQANTSIEKIADFIDEIKDKYNTNKTFLLGFSQGAILSYALSLKYPNKVQHVVALSGYINEDLLPKEIPNNITTDYYISHGIVDLVIPFIWAKKAPEFLSKLNLQNEFSEYPVGHGVAPQNFYSFKNWINQRL
ncbi:alpha/beta hydrolase [Tenacibaculum agarivorans]|uniref:alpha/beta hydrolase n=1 Tax=Tenacibaculum agarivorans TaxID=1908389 RepID=UPI00094B86B4|nr:alpha/beta fold hydrolase [Tenacibaculum agarivorans]